MSMDNNNCQKALKNARIAKNDEYYTLPREAELELSAYEDDCWRGKVVLCPFDVKHSAYVQWFFRNFKRLGIKELRWSHISFPYLFSYNGEVIIQTYHPLTDFLDDSYPLDGVDIIASNPPFSKWSQIYDKVRDSGCDFALMGTVVKLTVKRLFCDIRDKIVHSGGIVNHHCHFASPDGDRSVGGIQTYSSLPVKEERKHFLRNKRHIDRPTRRLEDGTLEVDNFLAMPWDYTDVMAVPITVAAYHDPEIQLIDSGTFTRDDGSKTFQRLLMKLKKD